MKLQIKVDDNGVIQDVKFKTFGTSSVLAVSDSEKEGALTAASTGRLRVRDRLVILHD